MSDRRRTRVALLAALLFSATLAVYLPVGNHAFLGYDDGLYVTNNRHVRNGLGLESLRWALTAQHAGNWHPLTWISHMADASLFGMEARGHHLMSAGIHATAAALLLAVLAGMTGALWRSAAVAAIFALHPLHVESVAWVSERKDVLSAFFWCLALGAHLRHARRPSPGRYAAVVAAAAAGLAAKSMLVTLPFVLLLADVWPLGRLGAGVPGRWLPHGGKGMPPARSVLMEKLPLLLMAAVAALLTWRAQGQWGAFRSTALIPLGSRIVNAVVSVAGYLGKALFPHDLVYFYPHRLGGVPAPEALAAGALVTGVTVVALLGFRRHPASATGWLLFLGMLVPVSGLAQVGSQAMADRYTYLPLVGLAIAAFWAVADALRRWRPARPAAAVVGVATLVLLALPTRLQIAVWSDDETLFAHALAVDSSNWRAANDLGGALLERGEIDRATGLFRAALREQPGYAEAHLNLGLALYRRGRPEEAITHFLQALRTKPDFAEAETNLGAALWSLGRKREAAERHEAALRIDPGNAEALNNLGVVLAGDGRYREAEERFRSAAALKPGFTPPLFNLGAVLEAQGRRAEAAEAYRRILAVAPEDAEAAAALRAVLAGGGGG